MMIFVPECEIVVLSAARTPQGDRDGAMAPFTATAMGGIAIKAALERAGVTPDMPDVIDECIMGNVISSGLRHAPAKQAAVAGGLSPEVPSKTVNTVCASGMTAIFDACLSLVSGVSRVVVAGGMESRTNAPYLLGPYAGGGWGDTAAGDGSRNAIAKGGSANGSINAAGGDTRDDAKAGLKDGAKGGVNSV